MYFEWFQYLQLSSLIIASICYQGLKHYGILIFIPLLFLDCLVDLLGDNYLTFGWKSNYFLYNYYLLITTPLYLIVFSKMLNLNGKLKIVSIAIGSLLMLLILINLFFIQGKSQFNSYSLLLIMVINVIFSSLILINLVTDDRQVPSLFKEPFFWINSAILLFSLGTLVVLGLQQYIAANRIKLNEKMLYNTVMHILNIILYSALSYGFILCRFSKTRLLRLQ